MKIDITKTILSINPNAEIVVRGDDVNSIEWQNGTQPITANEILAKKSELQALENVYVNRRNEYGSIVSQLDEIYHNGIDAWKTRIASVKNKYPK